LALSDGAGIKYAFLGGRKRRYLNMKYAILTALFVMGLSTTGYANNCGEGYDGHSAGKADTVDNTSTDNNANLRDGE